MGRPSPLPLRPLTRHGAASAATITVELPAQPISPWLRLAHRTVIGADGSSRGILRSCDDWMLMLQLQGTSFIWWQELGGSVPLPPGSVALIPPDRLHAWGVCPGAHIAIHFDLHAQPQLEAMAMLHPRTEMVEQRPLTAMPIVNISTHARPETLRIPLVTALRRPTAWCELIQPLIDLYGSRRHQGLAARLQAAGILTQALEALILPRDPCALDAPDPRILSVLAALDAEVARPWSVAFLARQAGMGQTGFRAAFLAATGTSPRAHLEALRVARATRLLIDTDQRIAVIGQAVGYADPYHFSRVFRRVTGRAPRSLRSGLVDS